MKTLTNTLTGTLIATALFLNSAKVAAAAVKNEAPGKETAIAYNRIKVSGNVTVLLSQGKRESVTVESDFDRRNLSVTKKGYTLMIHGKGTDRIVVTVVVKDLHRIDACEKAEVKTTGQLNLKYLQVLLKDYARADVKADTESLYTYTVGNADLKLSGNTLDHTLLKDRISKLDATHLTAARTSLDSLKNEMTSITLRGR